MRIKTLIAILAVLPFVSFGQQARQITLDDLIPKSQQQAMGIQKLTDEEKEALRQHILALLTAANVAVRSSEPRGLKAPSTSLSNSIAVPLGTESSATQPANMRNLTPQTTRVSRSYAGTGEGHWVKQNIDDGAFILLEDGSLWQVDPFDKIDASLWLSLSDITVVESSSGSIGYDYLLINTSDGEKAHAKYSGRQ